MRHNSDKVQEAIVQLCDALCEYERNTGIESILILREPDFVCRAVDGKPAVFDVTDEDMIDCMLGKDKPEGSE